MEKVLTLHSQVKPELIRKVLRRAIALTFLGLIGIIIGTIRLFQEPLDQWALFIFTAGLALMAIGLAPYFRLSYLSSKPCTIKVFGHERLEFFSKNQKKLTIPMHKIENIVFIDKEDLYGIGIQLKPAFRNQLIAKFHLMEHNPLQRRWQDEFEADAFFAYFGRNAFDELVAWRQSAL